MKYSLEEISKIIKGSFHKGSAPQEIDHLLLDSRKLIFPETSLFIPLVSERRNGHQFIEDLYRRGVRNFIVSEDLPWEKFSLANSVRVKDTQTALHLLAAWHRQQFKIPVVGITGSNGKTIVKEWLFHLLEKDFNIVRSPKSYNSQIGVPLSVWPMKPVHQLALFEAGISQPGEMANLERIIRPTIGIFTNIGEAHNEGFLNIRQKINEKLILFTKADILIYCKDYPELNDCILQFHNQVRKKNRDETESSLKLLTWSRKVGADLRVIGVDKNSNHTRIDAVYEGRPIFIRIPFVDDGSIENAIHCWLLLIYFQIPERDIKERMERLGNVAMRLELKEAINN
ncbi:MAG: Mur ligase family protein, partial [Chitinophagaceae bacterium]